MRRFGNYEYSGNVISCDSETLQLVIHSSDTFDDIARKIDGIREIVEINAGATNTYHVTVPISANTVSPTVHFLTFSTKLTPIQEMERQLAEQEDMINELSGLIDDLIMGELED